MKQTFIYVLAALGLCACSSGGGATITLPDDYTASTIVVSHLTLDNIFNAKSVDDLNVVYDTLEVKDHKAHMNFAKGGAAQYMIQSPEMTRMQVEFYAQQGDKLDVDIQSFDPLTYTVKGTELMDDLTSLNSTIRPIMDEYVTMSQNENFTEAQAKELVNRYDAAIKNFVAEHPRSTAIPYVITELSGDDFKTAYDTMTPEAKKSILMPYADAYNAQVEQMQAARQAEQDKADMYSSGTIAAADFTLPDLNGKQVSLSSYRGKWVVLDFWGSWCGWCIKGFPALKEAYEQYKDKLVVIGIDCNDSDSAWRAAVKQYELPWINVYNGESRDLYADYNVEGFPTKVIVNPEGMIVDVTTGEDPAFFTRLAEFLK